MNTSIKWELNIHPTLLTASDRAKTVILLQYLNKYGDIETTITELRKSCLPLIYPKNNISSSKEWHNNNMGRYRFIKRIKEIFKKHITKV